MKLKDIHQHITESLSKEDEQKIFDLLFTYVTSKKASDLSSSHGDAWFAVNRGKVKWNWRTRNVPATLVARELGIEINRTSLNTLADITTKVLESPEVEKIKAGLIADEKKPPSKDNELAEIRAEIARLQKRADELS